jgi:ATP/ADP translocase
MNSLIGYVRTLLPVRPEERGLTAFLYVLLVLMVMADWVGKIGSDSLFVKRFGVEYVPIMYIVTPIAMLVTAALLFAIIDRVKRRALLLGYVAAVLLASVVLQAMLPLGGLVYPIAYVFTHGVKETIYLVFWVYAGNLFDSEQSRRLFPLFAGAVLVGKILGGAVATGLADAIHSENFIGAQALGFMLCLIFLLAYRGLPEGRGRHVDGGHRPKGVGETVRDSLDGYRAVASDRVLRTLGLNVFFWYVLMQMGMYLYLVGLDASSVSASATQSEDAFTRLYASVYTSASLVALAIQVFLTSALLRRFGVALALLLLPVWYLLSYASAAIAFNFVTAVAIQLGERVWIPAVHRPTTELIYSQISSRVRPRARAFLSGGVNAMGNLAASGLLLGSAGLGLAASNVLALAAGISVVFVANAWSLRGVVGRRIAENLTSPEGDLRRNAVQMLPGEHRIVPTAALRAALVSAPADVEHGVRLALMRRDALALAVDAARD